jgi:hypothetical protein
MVQPARLLLCGAYTPGVVAVNFIFVKGMTLIGVGFLYQGL